MAAPGAQGAGALPRGRDHRPGAGAGRDRVQGRQPRGRGLIYFDSHCHLDFATLPAGACARAVRAGVRAVLVPGVDGGVEVPSPPGLRVLAAGGVHPAAELAGLATLADWLEAHPGAPVGEFGWDRHVRRTLPEQDGVCDAQLELARRLDRPVILHVVGRHGHALERLARHAPLRGVVHAYSGSAELVPRYLALGLSLSFGLNVLRVGARRVREAALRVPADRLLVETDGPDQHLPGVPHGEPADVVAVAERLAAWRGVSLATLAAETTSNASRLFLPPGTALH